LKFPLVPVDSETGSGAPHHPPLIGTGSEEARAMPAKLVIGRAEKIRLLLENLVPEARVEDETSPRTPEKRITRSRGVFEAVHAARAGRTTQTEPRPRSDPHNMRH
jgi:hypothetical protein